MVDRQSLAARMVAETRRGWRRPSSPVFPIRARTGGVPGLVSAIPASTAITDQPSSESPLRSVLPQHFGHDDSRRRLDQREMRERLWEVPEVAGGDGVELLRV